MISLVGLDKAAVLAALYNAAKPQGMGFLHYDPTPMTREQANEILLTTQRFDYLKGRVMKIDLSGSDLDERLYDRPNGPGAAAQAVQAMLEAGPLAESITDRHKAKTLESAAQTEQRLGTPSSVTAPGVFELGLRDVAGPLGEKIAEARRALKDSQ